MWGCVTAEEVLAAVTPRPAEVEDDAVLTQCGHTSSVAHVNSVDAFKKRIKKDKKDFPDLTCDHKWKHPSRHFSSPLGGP